MSLPAAILALLFAFDRPIPDDSPWWIHNAEVVTDAGRSTVALPWYGTDVAADNQGVRRLAFEVAFSVPQGEADEPWALLIPEPRSAFAVWLNGSPLDTRGKQAPPVSYLVWPEMVELAPGLLGASNVMRIETVRETTFAYAPQMLVGPSTVLEPHYHRLVGFGVRAVQVIMVAMVVLALLVLGLYLMRPQDTAYAWFGLALLLWSLFTSSDYFGDIPVGNRHVWFALTYVMLFAFVAAATVFIHRFLETRPRRFELVLGGVLVFGGGGLIIYARFCGLCFYWPAQNLWVPATLLLGLYIVARLVARAARSSDPAFRWLLPAAWIATVIGIRDWLWEIQVLQAGNVYYLPYASAIVLTVFGAIMLKRFADALTQSEALNREMEQRVAAKAQALEANYARLQEAERQQARQAERELINRDMHDGLGGQLVQALAVLDGDHDRQAARDAVQRCLTSLRLMIDATEAGDGDLVALLANLRHRSLRDLRRLGIDLKLSLPKDSVAINVLPQESMHLLKILQESIHNAVQHAQATELKLSLEVEGDHVVIRVTDNGRGLDPAADPGHGLANMRWRAETIGAEIDVRPASPGTAVTLRLPRNR